MHIISSVSDLISPGLLFVFSGLFLNSAVLYWAPFLLLWVFFFFFKSIHLRQSKKRKGIWKCNMDFKWFLPGNDKIFYIFKAGDTETFKIWNPPPFFLSVIFFFLGSCWSIFGEPWMSRCPAACGFSLFFSLPSLCQWNLYLLIIMELTLNPDYFFLTWRRDGVSYPHDSLIISFVRKPLRGKCIQLLLLHFQNEQHILWAYSLPLFYECIYQPPHKKHTKHTTKSKAY